MLEVHTAKVQSMPVSLRAGLLTIDLTLLKQKDFLPLLHRCNEKLGKVLSATACEELENLLRSIRVGWLCLVFVCDLYVIVSFAKNNCFLLFVI